MEDNDITVSSLGEGAVCAAVDPISKTEMEIGKLKELLAKKEEKLKKQKKKKREEEEKKKIAFERELGRILDKYLSETFGEAYTACRTAEKASELLNTKVREETA